MAPYWWQAPKAPPGLPRPSCTTRAPEADLWRRAAMDGARHDGRSRSMRSAFLEGEHVRGMSNPRQWREDQQQDRGGHPRPSDGNHATDADRAGEPGSQESAEGIGDAVREDPEGRVDPAQDSVWDDALDE